MTCSDINTLMELYLIGELDGAKRSHFQEHLAVCPDCDRRTEFEVKFNRTLRERLRGEPAPHRIVARIRRRLGEGSGGGRSVVGRVLLHPAAGYAVAATLGVALLLSVFQGRLPWVGPTTSSGASWMSVTGVLICVECEREHRTPEEQRRCREFNHHTGIRSSRGEIWSLVNRGAGAVLSARPELRGSRVRLEGPAYPAIRTLDAERFALL